jgi:hypothetical protein
MGEGWQLPRRIAAATVRIVKVPRVPRGRERRSTGSATPGCPLYRPRPDQADLYTGPDPAAGSLIQVTNKDLRRCRLMIHLPSRLSMPHSPPEWADSRVRA